MGSTNMVPQQLSRLDAYRGMRQPKQTTIDRWHLYGSGLHNLREVTAAASGCMAAMEAERYLDECGH